MKRGVGKVTRHWPDTDGERTRLLAPRNDVLDERTTDPGGALARFEQGHGPFSSYVRWVEAQEGKLVERTEYRLVLPWFKWLFGPAVRGVVARRWSYRAWWAPPDQLDATQVLVLGLLAAASVTAAFVNTLFTQTAEFAADDFGVGSVGIGYAGALVRAGIIVALPAALIADRLGRRRVVIWLAWLAPLLSLIGAAAPNFELLTVSQAFARPMGIALAFVIGVVAAEEMPKNSRAFAVSVLAMAAGFGAGVAVMSLRLADVGEGGWRLVYLVAGVWCIVALSVTRRLPETRRFLAQVARPVASNTNPADESAASATAVATPSTEQHQTRRSQRFRRNLLLLGAVAFAGNVFVAPASFFQNSYLEDVRGFSGGMIGLFSVLVGTPAGIGLIIGGQIADHRGRRALIAAVLPISVLAVIGAYAVGGPALWAFSLTAGITGSMVYPAMTVYRTELFPTASRTRASALISCTALIGGIGGLLATGHLIDRGWAYASVMGWLAIGQLIVTILVVAYYPETAHRELEDLNPADSDLPLPSVHNV